MVEDAMDWQNNINENPISWLLEDGEPGVRYLALRDLLDLHHADPQLVKARKEAHATGPIATVLENMQPEGYWVRPGPGYTAKYRSTAWALILLAQLGAQASEDERIRVGCAYLLEHALAEGGQFNIHGTASSTVDCLQGNLCWALLELGYFDPRLDVAFDWMARTVTGEGVAPRTDKEAKIRYYAYKCGPLFTCGPNGNRPCAWGGAKVMLAFGKLPERQRTPLIERAIDEGLEFFMSGDSTKAAWPTRLGDKPSRNWWKFGFPVFYITDLLQVVEALVGLGYGQDSRLAGSIELIRSKQDEHGRWALEYDYAGKTWGDYGVKNEANKWVTLRALRVLKRSTSDQTPIGSVSENKAPPEG
jgi:hypothetical protein